MPGKYDLDKPFKYVKGKSTFNDPHNKDPYPNLMTVREVAEMLRVVPLTVKRWGKKGKIKEIRINSRGDRRYNRDYIMEKYKI